MANSTQQESSLLMVGNRGAASVGAVFSVIVVIVVGVAAYLQWGGSFGAQTPTVSDVVAAHQSVDTFQQDSVLKVSADMDPEALEERSDADRLRQSLQYIPNLEANTFPQNVTAELNLTSSVSLATSSSASSKSTISVLVGADETEEVLAVDWRRADGTNYVRGRTLPDVPFFQLSQLEGQWYSTGSQTGNSLQSIGVSQESLDSVPEDVDISAKTTRELITAMVSEGVIEVVNTTKTELRSGAPAYQFDLELKPDSVASYQQAAQEIIAKSNPDLADSEKFTFSDEDMNKLQKDLQTLKEQLDQFRVWVARDTNYIHRVKLESEIAGDEIDSIAKQEEVNLTGVNSLSVTLDVGLSGFNDELDVQVPQGAQPIQQAFGAQFGATPSTGSAAGSVPTQGLPTGQ